jgi:uncharacterized membrane protein YfcA
LARPADRADHRARQHPAVFRRLGLFLPGQLCVDGLITSDAIRFSLLVGPVYAVGVWFGTRLFGRASERLFRAICYALIAAAVIIGLPLLDRVLR